MSRYVFTSESVTEGHPDKICDQVSDAVLDALLAQDSTSRVVVNTGLCMITGEVTSKAQVDFIHLVRDVIRDIGYSGARAGGLTLLRVSTRPMIMKAIRSTRWAPVIRESCLATPAMKRPS